MTSSPWDAPDPPLRWPVEIPEWLVVRVSSLYFDLVVVPLVCLSVTAWLLWRAMLLLRPMPRPVTPRAPDEECR